MSETTYPNVGFPDYSRYGPNGGRLIDSLTGPISGTPQTGILSTTGFAYMTLITDGTNTGSVYGVDVLWFNGDNLLDQIAGYEYIPNDATGNTVNMQVVSEWMQVIHAPLSGPGTAEPLTCIYGNTTAPVGTDIKNGQNLYLNTNPTLTAGSNSQNTLTGCGPGTLKLHVYSPGTTSWLLQVKGISFSSGNFVELYQFPGASWPAGGVVEINVPPTVILIEITNQSAATETFLVTCVAY